MMININLGTFDQLKTRVGIGDTYAKRIVEGRPYHRTDELVTKNVIPKMTYDKIKDLIISWSSACPKGLVVAKWFREGWCGALMGSHGQCNLHALLSSGLHA